MKKLLMVGGTMGVGKTTTCQILKRRLPNSVFLDGDWCWDMHPFQPTDETRAMVVENLCFLLNQFIRCSAYEHVIFCWVMHEQQLLETLLGGLHLEGCRVFSFSLLCRPDILARRLQRDVASGLRSKGLVGRTLARLPLYERIDTRKVDVSHLTPEEAAARILARL